jgi:hypothetical protein
MATQPARLPLHTFVRGLRWPVDNDVEVAKVVLVRHRADTLYPMSPRWSASSARGCCKGGVKAYGSAIKRSVSLMILFGSAMFALCYPECSMKVGRRLAETSKLLDARLSRMDVGVAVELYPRDSGRRQEGAEGREQQRLSLGMFAVARPVPTRSRGGEDQVLDVNADDDERTV